MFPFVGSIRRLNIRTSVGLSASGKPHDDEDFPFFYRKTDIVDPDSRSSGAQDVLFALLLFKHFQSLICFFSKNFSDVFDFYFRQVHFSSQILDAICVDSIDSGKQIPNPIMVLRNVQI